MESTNEQAAPALGGWVKDIKFSDRMEVELIEATLSDSAIASAIP